MTGQLEPRTGRQLLWNSFARKPPTRLEAGFGVAVCSVVLVALAPTTLHDVWVSLFWPRAEAVVVGEPERGPPEQKRGHAYGVKLLTTLPDGRSIIGSSLKPLFDEVVPPRPPNDEARRVPPRVGDRLTIPFDPARPERMVPHRELTSAFGLPILVQLLFLGAGGRAFYYLFRKRPLEKPTAAVKPS